MSLSDQMRIIDTIDCLKSEFSVERAQTLLWTQFSGVPPFFILSAPLDRIYPNKMS